MVTIKQQVPPPYGWVYEEDGIQIKGLTYADLIQNVLKWRLQARKPVHTVQLDVNAYIARVSPQSVLIRKDQLKHKLRTEQTFSDRIYNFACRVYDNFKPDAVSATPHEAERRAKICAECPYNQSYSFNCPACQSETNRLLQGVRSGRTTQHDRRLKGCARLGYDLATAVWLENDQLGPASPDPRLPNNCWRKAK